MTHLNDISARPPRRRGRTLLAALGLGVAVALAITVAALAAPVPALFQTVKAMKVSSGVSTNWSGYAVTVSSTTFASVTGTWVQPTVDCSTATGQAYSAFWVGLGGATDGSETLEQIGTDENCT